MRKTIKKQIRKLNSRFYDQFAKEFSATRQRIQPGVSAVLDKVSSTASILDLGCGNGSVVRSLADRGHKGNYFGVDFSEELIAMARNTHRHPGAQFIAADFCSPDWSSGIEAGFEHVFCFAVLHHIPEKETRLRMVQQAANLMANEAGMTVSVWNFLASPRLTQRILPWSVINITDGDVDPGDYLLDWRRGGSGIRYIHHFSEEELSGLAESAGLCVAETFYSDGENGRLGMYQRWINIRHQPEAP